MLSYERGIISEVSHIRQNMRGREIKYILGIAFVFITFCIDTFGCSIFVTGTPIEARHTKATSVFLGKVLKIENFKSHEEEFATNAKRITFKVAEQFKGDVVNTLSVVTPDWRGACGLHVRRGQMWMIFANRTNESGVLETTSGFRYEPAEDAAAATTLRKAKFGETDTVISGTLTTSWANGYEYEPAEVRISNGAQEWTVFTDAHGKFRFASLPAGNYNVQVKFPFRAASIYDISDPQPAILESDSLTIRFKVQLSQGQHDYSFFEVFRYSDKK